MAYLVPNATDTGNTARFVDANQAEPDALDIEALGLRSNWVRNGGVVTYSGTSNITVTGGTVVISDRPYTFSSVSALTISAADTDRSRFDVVLARLTGGSVSVVVIPGAESATNPTLPRSRSVLAADVGFNSSIHVDPATDVLLATVYKVGAANLSAANIVDKRIISGATTTWSDTSIPTDATVGKVGDTVIRESTGAVYMKVKSAGVDLWSEITQTFSIADYVLPVGAIFAWAGPSGDPPNSVLLGDARFLPCDGRSLSVASYPVLYDVVGTTYGGASVNGVVTSFKIPDITGSTAISGVSRGNADYGVVSGSNSIRLTRDNLPSNPGTNHKHATKLRKFTGALPSSTTTAYNSDRALAAPASGGTTETADTTNSQLENFGKETPDTFDVRGKRINLSYYMRVK